MAWKTWRWEGGLLAGYVFFILAETVLTRKPLEGQHLNLEPLWSWQAWNVQKEQILMNVVMFVPIGVLAGRLWRWKGALVAIGLSLAIEFLQLISTCGLCELDDVIHNIIGAGIGVGIAMVARNKLR